MTTKGRLSLEDESLKKTLETTQSVTVIADAHAVATFVLANFILCVCVLLLDHRRRFSSACVPLVSDRRGLKTRTQHSFENVTKQPGWSMQTLVSVLICLPSSSLASPPYVKH